MLKMVSGSPVTQSTDDKLDTDARSIWIGNVGCGFVIDQFSIYCHLCVDGWMDYEVEVSVKPISSHR